jgi:hypothetical protein
MTYTATVVATLRQLIIRHNTMTEEQIKAAMPKNAPMPINSGLAKPLLETVRQLPDDLGRLVIAAAVGVPQPARVYNQANRSRYPYYKRKYGEGIRPALDKMLADKEYEPLFSFLSMKHMNKVTLVICIRQAFDWVIDFEMDDAKKEAYRNLRSEVNIKAVVKGVVVARLLEPNLMLATPSTKADRQEKNDVGFMDRIITFIEQAEEGSTLNIPDCPLSEKEIENIDKLIGQLPTFRWSYNQVEQRIAIRHLTENQMTLLQQIQP